MNTQT